MNHRNMLAVFALAVAAPWGRTQEVIDIGSRRELFVDRYLIHSLTNADLRLHQPTPREMVFTADAPWEGNTSAYFTIFQDGPLYRMYYRGAHFDEKTKKAAHRELACYAESTDGIHWTKPELGLFEFNGSKKNNIIWDGPGTHNFAPFKDANPAAPEDSRYKALARDKGGLLAFQSADGIHWKLMRDKPVITQGKFDSQNLAFWDPVAKLYREYHRGFTGGVRAIMTGTSKDFLRWTEPVYLDYGKAPKEHLYTNAIRRYERAPQLLIGFPTRFQPKNQQVEPIFMTSRDGLYFERWPEAVVPITAPENRDGNRSNYMTNALVQLPGKPGEWSVYATEAYYTGPGSRLRRFTYRLDGFISVHAKGKGDLVTKPFRFKGDVLTLNLRTSRSGSIRVEAQTAKVTPIAGFRLDDCNSMRGDALAQPVTWKNNAIGKLAGQTIRLRFEIADADLYSLKFEAARK